MRFGGASDSRFWPNRGVIQHKHRIGCRGRAHRLGPQLSFQAPGIPDPSGDEVVQLIVITRCKPFRHWLNALAVPETDQP